MFVEIKKHPGVLNEQLVTFSETFFLNLSHVQKVWFGKATVYVYHDSFFQTKNLARIHAEGVAQQQVVQHSDLKFGKTFEQEIAQIREIEIDHIQLKIVGLKEETEMHLYFTETGTQELSQFKQLINVR